MIGLACPACNHLASGCVDSRPTDRGASVRRRRECKHCGARFTTIEECAETVKAVVPPPSPVSRPTLLTQRSLRERLIAGEYA